MKLSSRLRKWGRVIHRDLSYLFSGMLIIYAISGIVMNHRRSISPDHSIEVIEYVADAPKVEREQIDKAFVQQHYLAEHGLADSYTKHFFPKGERMRVLIKGGSSLTVDLSTNAVTFEKLERRYVIGAMARLHYNPGKWWTIFADLFGASLIVIVLTGLIIVKGKRGIWGVGGIELLIGILIPLAFLFLF